MNQPMTMHDISISTKPAVMDGLKGVVFTESKLSFIDGEKGILKYVGIPIQELAQHSTYEETAFLLFHARLPNATELSAFDDELKKRRSVPAGLVDLMRLYPKDLHPMHALRTAVSSLAMFDPNADDTSEGGKLEKALNLTAQTATIIAALFRLQQGQEPIAPRLDLSHAANFLYMLHGQEPSLEQARLFDIALILHADHGMNASTFTGIATASTLSDMYSSITSAIGSLKGPLHGGANEAVMDMLAEIGSPENAEGYIGAKLERKEKIMGVGHAVYKFFDPRSRVLKEYAQIVANKHGKSLAYSTLEKVEEIVVGRLGTKGIYPNVDFYSGVVYSDLGLPKTYFTPIFALSRMAGWTASIIEYTRKNSILRPTANYIGPAEAHWVPLEQR
ncbi:MAG: citrate/2-methylcitrate synthase [Deinococcales bacterium]